MSGTTSINGVGGNHVTGRLLRACAFLAVAWAGSSGAQPTTVCKYGSAIDMGELDIQRCNFPWDANALKQRDELSSYYGRVLIRTTGAATLPTDRKFQDALKGFFNIKDETTAVVNLAAYIQRDGEEVLVFEAPMFKLARAASGKVSVSNYSHESSQLQISPYFALNRANSNVRIRTNISLVTTRTSGAVAEVESLAKTLPATNWLLTAASDATLLSLANKLQAASDKYHSTVALADADTILGFEGGAHQATRYTVTWAGKVDARMAVDVYLDAVPSLITQRTRVVDGFLRPDVSMALGTRWAEAIPVDPKRNVADIIKTPGVPRPLVDLRASGAQPAADRLALVESACQDLRTALRTGESSTFRLNDHDADLVLFDELRLAGVFDLYKPSQLTCLNGMAQRWKSRYDIEARGDVVVPWAHMENRLKKLWHSWRKADATQRAEELREDIVLPNVTLVAPPGFIAGGAEPDEDGLVRAPVGATSLAVRRQTCFGNYAPVKDAKASATVLAQFDDQPELYELLFTFQTTEDYARQQGPLVRQISVQPATSETLARIPSPSCPAKEAVANNP
jgi:hypothetical protein